VSGFADLVRDCVAIANDLTSTLQANVTHYPWLSATKDSYGKVTWVAVVRPALVEERTRLVRNQQGEHVVATCTVTFLVPVAVDPRDRIVLPSGRETPIMNVSDLVDPDTKLPYMTQVALA